MNKIFNQALFLIITLFVVPVVFAKTILIKTNEYDEVYVEDSLQRDYKNLVNFIVMHYKVDGDSKQYYLDILRDNSYFDEKILLSKAEKELKKVNSNLEVNYSYKKSLSIFANLKRELFKNYINNDEMEKTGELPSYYLCYKKNEFPRLTIRSLKSLKMESPYLLEDDLFKLSKSEKIIFLKFGNKIIKSPDTYKNLYGKETFLKYINKIKQVSIVMNDMSTLKKLYQNKLIDEGAALISLYTYQNKYVSAALTLEKQLSSDKWKNKLIMTLSELTNWKNKKNCNLNCVDEINRIIKSYFKKMTDENYPFKFSRKDKYKIVESYFSSHLLLLDYVLLFNKENITPSFEKKSYDFISRFYNFKKSFVEEDDYWYHRLTSSYFDGKIKNMYSDIKSEYESSDDPNVLEGHLLEVSAYLSLYFIKKSQNNMAYLTLSNAKNLGNSVYSKAYGYIEKEVNNSLINYLNSSTTRTKGGTKLGVYEGNGKFAKFRPFSTKYAIIIGISNYKYLSKSNAKNGAGNILYDLKYAKDDALGFRDFLNMRDKAGGNWKIKLFTNENATEINIRSHIDNILTKAKKHDLIYIFFSGHARLSPNSNDEVYLLPYDFKPDNPYSGIPYDWLVSTIHRSDAKHLVAFVDACRSGVVKNSKGIASFDQNILRSAFEHSPTKIIFTSGSGSQISYEDDILKKGVFTYYLLKGLNGESLDDNNDGLVNLNELLDYTSSKVSKYTQKSKKFTYQRPSISNLDPNYSIQFPLAIR